MDISSIRPRQGQGRPSKGERDAILVRFDPELGEALYFRALQEHLTPGEYAVKLLAEDLSFEEYVPEPSVRRLSSVPEPTVRDGKVSIKVRPHIHLGAMIKHLARVKKMPYGAYVAERVSELLGFEPAARPEQLFDGEGASLTAVA